MKVTLVSPDLFQYTLDRTGVLPANKVVDEVHALPTAANRLIVPVYGAFFDDSVVIKDASNAVVATTKYKSVELIKEATQETGKPVSKFLAITDPTVAGPIKLTYQVLGGERAYNHDLLTQYVIDILAQTPSVDWNDLQDKPREFTPGHHLHDAQDLYGMEWMTRALKGVEEAILTGSDAFKHAMRTLIIKKNKDYEAQFATLFAQRIKAKIQALEVAAGKAPGSSRVTGTGTLLRHYCQGTTLRGIYYNGATGTTDEIIALNSPTCGGVPKPPAIPLMRLQATHGFIWPDVQPRNLDVYSLPLATPNSSLLKVGIGSRVSARVILQDLVPDTTYEVNFAKLVQGYTQYVVDGTVAFTSDNNGQGVVDYTWPTGLFTTNQYSTLQDNRLIACLGPVDQLNPFKALGGITNVVSIFTEGAIGVVPETVVPKTQWSHPFNTGGTPSIALVTAQQAQALGDLSGNPQPSYLLLKNPANGQVPCFSYTTAFSGRFCFIMHVAPVGGTINPVKLTLWRNNTFVRQQLASDDPYFQWLNLNAGDKIEFQLTVANPTNGSLGQGLVDLRVIAPDNDSFSAASAFLTYNGAQRAPWAYFYRGSEGVAASLNPDGPPVLS